MSDAAMIRPEAPDDGARFDPRRSHLYAAERESLGPVAATRLFIKSWPFIGEHRRLAFLKCGLSFISLVFFLATPWPLKIVIDNVIDAHPLTGWPAAILLPIAGPNRMALLFVVCAFLGFAAIAVGMVGDRADPLGTAVDSGGLDQAGFTQNEANDGWSLWNGLFGYYETLVTLDLTQRINQSVRTAIYRRFLRSPLGMYSDQKVGDAVFRVMHDSASIGAVLYTAVLAPLMSVVMFVLALIVLWAQFPAQRIIPILAALMLPAVAIGGALFGRLLRNQSQNMRERGSDVMAAFEERIAQVSLIKAFGTEKREAASVDAASWRSYRSALRMLAIVVALGLVIVPAAGALVIASIYYLMTQVITGKMTLGDVVLLLSYGAMLSRPAGVIGGTWASIQPAVAGLRRVHSVLDGFAEDSAPGDRGAAPVAIQEIALRDVAVGYSAGVPVLSNVSFTIRSGEMIAIAGPSGAGKTTLVLAIPRFIELAAGDIAFDGKSIHQFTPGEIRSRVGFVFQNEALFSETIADNIRYGRRQSADEEIRRAAAMAGAAEFIERLPDGYATLLGRRGARLSVGQKQRIAIARAILCNPGVLVLDEPAAPLDPVSESALIATLRELARTRIVVIVAHRANTLAACDRVIFIKDGTLAASGPHAELIDTSPDYRRYLAMIESEIHG
ncbi:MAG TPA: ABC transporter ATP-binding protein [Candidatus Binataceae bacterium]|nr:ABC transporter ATP-binding protein [Candidatus Binataceae bacterium]